MFARVRKWIKARKDKLNGKSYVRPSLRKGTKASKKKAVPREQLPPKLTKVSHVSSFLLTTFIHFDCFH